MPPSRRSSSSSSSRSRSSGGASRRSSSSSYRSSSSGRSSYRSSSYRSSSYGRSSYGGSSYGSGSYRSSSSRGDYGDYDDYSWKDALEDVLGQVPRGVYGDSYIDSYDEGRDFECKQYGSRTTVEKKPDEPKKAHFICGYCDSKLEEVWKEGYYPTCKNCGAQMTKQAAVATASGAVAQEADAVSQMKRLLKRKTIFIPFLLMLIVFLPQLLFGFQACVTQQAISEKTEYNVADETNLQIYGSNIYLDNIYDDTYKICESWRGYEKCITWDYGIGAYYDAESDCYLWYNTDVSPNVWQYWYEDIAGDNYYGWMEYAGDKWYIEVSDTQWEEYTGDTSGLWHIGDWKQY